MSLYREKMKTLTGKIKAEASDTEANDTALWAEVTGKVTADGGVYIVPTVDPAIAGALWNNSDTLSISAG